MKSHAASVLLERSHVPRIVTSGLSPGVRGDSRPVPADGHGERDAGHRPDDGRDPKSGEQAEEQRREAEPHGGNGSDEQDQSGLHGDSFDMR